MFSEKKKENKINHFFFSLIFLGERERERDMCASFSINLQAQPSAGIKALDLEILNDL